MLNKPYRFAVTVCADISADFSTDLCFWAHISANLCAHLWKNWNQCTFVRTFQFRFQCWYQVYYHTSALTSAYYHTSAPTSALKSAHNLTANLPLICCISNENIFMHSVRQIDVKKIWIQDKKYFLDPCSELQTPSEVWQFLFFGPLPKHIRLQISILKSDPSKRASIT